MRERSPLSVLEDFFFDTLLKWGRKRRQHTYPVEKREDKVCLTLSPNQPDPRRDGVIFVQLERIVETAQKNDIPLVEMHGYEDSRPLWRRLVDWLTWWWLGVLDDIDRAVRDPEDFRPRVMWSEHEWILDDEDAIRYYLSRRERALAIPERVLKTDTTLVLLPPRFTPRRKARQKM